jgi:cobaltochelatase CobN
VILFLTTADTEILAAARARSLLPEGFGEIGAANPAHIEDPARFLDEALPECKVVLVRLLGGRSAWPDGFALVIERCRELGIPLLAFGGEREIDAELTEASTAPAGVVAQALEYLRCGGIENIANLWRFVADTLLLEGFGFEEPQEVPDAGIYRPELLQRLDPARPTVGIVFYRAHLLSGNTAFVDDLIAALEKAGANALAVYSYSLRNQDSSGRVPALELLSGKVDCLVVTVLASGGAKTEDQDLLEGFYEWDAHVFEDLDVPVIQGVCATTTRSAWLGSSSGLTPLDAAMQVAIPEFDGRIIGQAWSFKEPLEADSQVLAYQADPERTDALARCATAHARLRRATSPDKKVAVVLSSYPTRHSRIGNAVGLDTPASAVRLLHALGENGFHVEGIPDDGDALVHDLIAAGGYDEEFLTSAQLRDAEHRLDARTYVRWFNALPAKLRNDVERHWGESPGNLYVDDGDFVVAGIRFGNIFVCIQPPRGFGENPVAIYHDPELPPPHHYLAFYWWLEREFGADAIIHLGKHGTLEWLPGKSLALSQECSPDAALGPVPLFYPFVVNDPGEGTQAKRRAHAVVIDHLVPPMMRAETYDDLARLEQLLDEHAQMQALDPTKLPEIRARIWTLVHAAELHRDLGVDEHPVDFDAFVSHLDGYLCEIKDLQIRDGLHILGESPLGDQKLGLVAAILRVPAGRVHALRSAVASAYQLDEATLMDALGAPASAPEALLDRFPGPAVTGADLIDRLEEATRALLTAMETKGWEAAVSSNVCADVLGIQSAEVAATLAFAASEIVPRLERTSDEIANLIRGLEGGFVAPGRSGSPTRGHVNVLPTGRNFYSVDPKALPSELAWTTGLGLSEDLLSRYLSEEGAYPETVGVVVWGTSAMRTHGDDIAEILALLGTRPVWDEPSRRVTGIEVIPLAELGRPRVDVAVRISGFFRDAFPNLIALMDDAFQTVANLRESDDDNFVAKHARAELAAGGTQRTATMRIFGSKPGAYGAGLLPLIDARNWRSDADLVRVYETWGGYAYGAGLDGREAIVEMRANFARIKVAVKNVDTREHDLFDSDDFFQYHGGMVAAVRAMTGKNPRAFIGDSADPNRVRNRDLAEEARRVFRSRVVNPRWIASMRRHGYKGAFELSATVDYMFGYDATTGVVDDWMYEQVAERYVFDPDTAEFIHTSNPWAFRAISERLLEAADRGLWAQPNEDVLHRLRAAYLQMDASLEDGTS